MSKADKEIKEIKNKKSFTEADWPIVANYVRKLFDDRKRDRKDREKLWSEIERQLNMIPDVAHKSLPDGSPDTAKAWMPEMELPLQSQTLEILTADMNRQMFPSAGPFYRVNSDISQSLFDKYEQAEIIRGDDIIPLSDIAGRPTFDQEDVNLVVQSVMDLIHFHSNFEKTWDFINAEASAKGVGIGRIKRVKRKVMVEGAKGVFPEELSLPCLIPYSIKDVYLDDRHQALTNEGFELGPNIIFHKTQSYVDVRLAAEKGSKDPNDENGGWMPAQFSGITGDEDDGTISVLEFEGDLVTSRNDGESIYVPNCIVTVVIGNSSDEEGRIEPRVVRFRWRNSDYSSYIVVPYHYDGLDTVYANGPLTKGMPIQKAATEAFNRLLMTVAFDAQPVLQYDKDDPTFMQTGGPEVYPGAQIGSQTPVNTIAIGNPSAMSAVYQMMLEQYETMTGMNPARFGASTTSHTTAFAKDQEITQGAMRTVDYVKNTLRGPMQQWLNIAYEMVRKNFPTETLPCYMHKVKMFVNVSKELLPDRVHFDVIGADANRENALKQQNMINSLQTAVQLNTIQLQTQTGEPLNYSELIKEVLREGGFQDVERFTLPGAEQTAQGSEAQPGMGGGLEPNAGNLSTALQALAFNNGGD